MNYNFNIKFEKLMDINYKTYTIFKHIIYRIEK